MQEKWYKKAWRRNVVDMHIDDWDPLFLSEFDPENYVNMLTLAGVDSAVVYAHSHVGHCYYQTDLGHRHAGIQGRDIFREVVDLCHKNNIAVVAYYSLIFNNWLYQTHPDWQIMTCEGKEAGENSRYGVCCPNSPYRDQVLLEIKELCENYEFEGLRYDMTFWPTVCYCKYCAQRYEKEVGSQLPRKVNWRDPDWVAFQRKREAWLVDFAKLTTDAARRYKPGVSVEHQSSTFPLGWQFGVTTPLAKQNDFLQGDFYGGLLQQSFVCKLLQNLTVNRPAGYETSLTGHIVGNNYKSKELLEMHVLGAVANSAAFIFIDSIHPTGRLNADIYKTMRAIFDKTRKYDSYLGGELKADVAIFLSTESKNEMTTAKVTDQDVAMNSTHGKMPHTENAVNTARAMIHNNILYDVITRENLDHLSKYQVVIIGNAAMMDDMETEALRNYVKNGGSLYAGKYTSLFHKDGNSESDFMLSDVFGVSYEGETRENVTFITPTAQGQPYAPQYGKDYPMSIGSTQLKVKASEQAVVLGKMVLPYTLPQDKSRFVSIHTNPPGIPTDNPSIVIHSYGQGKVVYVSCELENEESHEPVFVNLIQSLIKNGTVLKSDAPKSVEITVFHQEENKRFIVNFLNYQQQLPNIPISQIDTTFNTGSLNIKSVKQIPNGNEIPFKASEKGIKFMIKDLKNFVMLTMDYK